MARGRLELHEILKGIMGEDAVYFQPPTNLIMTYPCIVYKRDDARTLHADNQPFRVTKRYLVTVIDKDPDSGIPDAVAVLPSVTFERHFTADNLNHDVFTIFF